jgi:hypothetical protein
MNMASKVKTKALPLPLPDFEKRLAKFFFIAAGLSILSILWNFAPSFRITVLSGSVLDQPNGFIAGFGDSYYVANPCQWIAIIAVGISALISAYFALQAFLGNKFKQRGLLVVIALVFDLAALVLQYLGYVYFGDANFLSALNQSYSITWGFILVAAFELAAMFIKWFFVNRLEAPKA